MGNLTKRMALSEIVATLEILEQADMQPEHFDFLRRYPDVLVGFGKEMVALIESFDKAMSPQGAPEEVDRIMYVGLLRRIANSAEHATAIAAVSHLATRKSEAMNFVLAAIVDDNAVSRPLVAVAALQHLPDDWVSVLASMNIDGVMPECQEKVCAWRVLAKQEEDRRKK